MEHRLTTTHNLWKKERKNQSILLVDEMRKASLHICFQHILLLINYKVSIVKERLKIIKTIHTISTKHVYHMTLMGLDRFQRSPQQGQVNVELQQY